VDFIFQKANIHEKKISIATTSIDAWKILPKHLITTRNGVQQPLFVFVESQ